jgi:hypothetical protein
MMNRRCVRLHHAISAVSAIALLLLAAEGKLWMKTAQADSVGLTESKASARRALDASRGIRVVPGGASSNGLRLEIGLQVRRGKSGLPHPLHDGGAVMTGDRIRVHVQSSRDAYIYLAFCADHSLTAYPSPRGIRTRAGEVMQIPQGDAELVVDDEPGREVLYVIASEVELSIVDPQLQQALAPWRPDGVLVDCKPGPGPGVASAAGNRRALVTPKRSTSAMRDAKLPRKRLAPVSAPEHTPISVPETQPSSDSQAPVAKLGAPAVEAASASPPPDPDFERSPGDIVWYRFDAAPPAPAASDDDAIAVVRYAFTHVEQGPSPSP